MRIAQVSPLYESVPPAGYGGTERVVAYLTEALVRQGHEVTLFASGDSQTSARLVHGCRRSLRTDPENRDPLAMHYLLLEEVFRRSERFDIIHFHTDYLHYPFLRRRRIPHLTTLHGRLDLTHLGPLYREYADEPVVSISHAQRAPLSQANWIATVHHGLPLGLHQCRAGRGGYLAFLGRVSPEKRLDRAIEIARRVDMPLKIAAKIDSADRSYFHSHIEPLLNAGPAEFLGEIGEDQKSEFLGDAYALLFPIDWPEPFGLVMIEAMACGLPVIAWRAGSVPEIVEDGLTGFLVETLDEAVTAVGRVAELDRRRCREVFEARFSDERMCRDYVTVYQRLVVQEGLHVDGRTEGHGRSASQEGQDKTGEMGVENTKRSRWKSRSPSLRKGNGRPG